MKKFIFVLIALLFVASQVFASGVAVENSSGKLCQASSIYYGSGQTVTCNGSTATVSGAVASVTSGSIQGVTTLAFGTVASANSVQFVNNGLEAEGATANDYEQTVLFRDPTADKTAYIPNRAGEVSIQGAGVALTPSASVALTVGSNLYTDLVTDNEDQTITFSGAGVSGEMVTVVFTTAGTADEVITFHATLVSSVGTLTLGTDAGKYYSVTFISNGTHWYEVARTAVQT